MCFKDSIFVFHFTQKQWTAQRKPLQLNKSLIANEQIIMKYYRD